MSAVCEGDCPYLACVKVKVKDGKQKKNDVMGESRNSDSLFMSRVVAYVSCDIDIGAAFETA